MQSACATINLAGYSAHHRPFIYRDQRNGLNTYLFRLQIQGQARARVRQDMQTVEAGDLLLYRPGDPYELEILLSREDESRPASRPISCDYFVFCSGGWLDGWWEESDKPPLLRVAPDSRLVSVWDQLVRERYTSDGYSEGLSDSLLRTLCLMISRSIVGVQTQRRADTALLVHTIREFVEEHAISGFSMQDVADHVGLSTSRVMHLFKETFGLTVVQYALDIKLNIARQRMVLDDTRLEDVSLDCGFQSYSYFYRVFVERFNLTPTEFRRQNR
ncbi:MAG: AraC family transcriptional regulator [Firmicutes bacterium]|nr:AraC family transcriptional regulator [Bacillota bacterium]